MKITKEIIKELNELANWNGYKTRNYFHLLLELRESYLPTHCSIEFAEALDTELIVLYNSLKEFKADDDELAAELSYADKRQNALDKLTDEEKKILGLI